jgi:hypothetical protein
MTVRRLILGALALVSIGAAVSLVLLVSSLDRVVAFAIENYGSEIAGANVQVESVEIRLRDGEGTIRGLRVGNPDGFGTDDAIRIEKITLGIDIASLRDRDPIVIDMLDVTAPVVKLVLDGRGRSNLKAIEQNVEAYGGEEGGEDGGEEGDEASPKPAASLAAPTLLRIRRFSVERGSLAVDLKVFGQAGVKVSIPEVNERDIGGRDGATPGEIGAVLAGAFLESVLSAVAASPIQAGIDGLLDGAFGESKRATRAADDVKKLLRGFVLEPKSKEKR